MSDSEVLKNKSQKKKFRPKYSILTIFLLICIAELMFGAVQNINKTINFSSKIKGLENKRNEELNRNKQLKSDIENFNSEKSLESIARDSLKMAEEDEILVIINKPNDFQESDVPVNYKTKK